MSEYEYYEFQAIDRPLTVEEMRILRSCSTRATITATRVTNHYEWGSFKGNPTAWMEKYFDAFFLAKARKEREAERASRERARREQEQAVIRERQLASLAKREAEAWREVDALIETKRPGDYDKAVELLKDLTELGKTREGGADTRERIARLQHAHARKPTLLKRLRAAGLLAE